MAPEGLCRLVEDGGAAMGSGRSSADRLPGPALLCGAEKEGWAEEPRRGRSRVAEDVREAGDSAEGTGDPGWRRSGYGGEYPDRGGCGVRQRLGCPDVPGDTAQGGGDF